MSVGLAAPPLVSTTAVSAVPVVSALVTGTSAVTAVVVSLVIVGIPVFMSTLSTPTDLLVSASTTCSAATPSVPIIGVTVYTPPSLRTALPALGTLSPLVELIKLSVAALYVHSSLTSLTVSVEPPEATESTIVSKSPVKSPSLSNELVEPPTGSTVAAAAALSAALGTPTNGWLLPTVKLIKPAVGSLTLFNASCICSGVACVASKPIISLRAFIPASIRPSKPNIPPMLDVP